MSKTVLVTGAARGIGNAIAKKYAEAGHKVIAISRNSDLLNKLKSEHESVEIYPLDLLAPSQIENLSNVLNNTKIDILVNNAGGGYIDSEDGLDFSGWEKTYKINVLVPMQLSKILAKNLSLSDSPQIFIVTSLAGHFLFRGSRPEYTIAKHAESSLSSVLRLELANKNIRVTEICPGTVNTRSKGPNALESEDIANAVFWASESPSYVNIDLIQMTHINNTII